jgi:hypothetical protein
MVDGRPPPAVSATVVVEDSSLTWKDEPQTREQAAYSAMR